VAATRPISSEIVQLRRYRVEVLSGASEGTVASPDSNGILRVGRAARVAPANTAGWLILEDPSVSELHFEASARPTGVLVRDTSLNGTWLGDARICGHQFEVTATADLRVGEVDLRVVVESEQNGVTTTTATAFGDLTGTSLTMRRLFAQVAQVAQHNLPVVITGETGTGKSALARAIHDRSRRSGRPFAVIDSTALSAQLLLSELFGHKKGAFTGALSDRAGLFEECQGGTVLLDEIGELPPDAQSALLRVLQEKKVRRVGESHERDVDVRVIAATHRDLANLVARGRFRLDLYMRLAVCTVEMPALRERPEDVLPIAEALLERIRREGEVDVPAGFTLSKEVRDDLARRDWLGNVRELYNYLRAHLAMGGIPRLMPISRMPPPPKSAAFAIDDLLDLKYDEAHVELLRRFDRVFLPHQLVKAKNRQGAAAKRAGIHRVTFARRLDEVGLRKSLAPNDAPDETVDET
jgi:DNA-binding NtrC family response regulator